jgi:hypothetical protein
LIAFFALNSFLGRLILAIAVLSGSALLVMGQTVNTGSVKEPSETRVRPSNQSTGRNNVDEAFELNIDERRYSQENFEASTAVGTKGAADKLNLQIGVALAAGRIDVLLRNVRGRVRFRGTLDRIFEMINNRQAPAPTVPARPSPAPSPE